MRHLSMATAFLVTTLAFWQVSITGGAALAPDVIVPGVGIGPARLGMMEAQARRVLAKAGLTTPECSVDVLVRSGRVIALGTRFGGCLFLPLPARASRLVIARRTVLPEATGIGGSPAPLIRAFGPAARFTLDPFAVALVWNSGLVARIAITEAGETITYLGVVPAGTPMPPFALLTPLPITGIGQ